MLVRAQHFGPKSVPLSLSNTGALPVAVLGYLVTLIQPTIDYDVTAS